MSKFNAAIEALQKARGCFFTIRIADGYRFCHDYRSLQQIDAALAVLGAAEKVDRERAKVLLHEIPNMLTSLVKDDMRSRVWRSLRALLESLPEDSK